LDLRRGGVKGEEEVEKCIMWSFINCTPLQMSKPTIVILTKYVARIGLKRVAYDISVGKPGGKSFL
jgi:hypothetical protein